MKTRFFTLMLATLMVAISSFASGTNMDVNRKVLSSFTSKFARATDINWSRTESYLKASFKQDDQCLFAYYRENGDLIGVSRNIKSTMLPLRLQSDLKADFANTWITELFEFATNDDTIYVASVENANEKLVIKSADGSSWQVSQKVKKP